MDKKFKKKKRKKKIIIGAKIIPQQIELKIIINIT